MSSSSTKICFNPECKDGKPERFRNGWRLRTGEHAELCDACGLAYEEGRFCETFHSEASGWRSCESCGKRVHCGCIVSIHTFMLLDAGGVECMACARKNFIMAQNPTWPSSLFVPLPLPDRLKDLSVKNWSQMAGPGIVAGPWRQSPNLWNTVQPELHQRIPYEVDRSNGNDKLIYSEHPASVSENKNIEVPSERVMSGSLKLAATDMVANGNAGIDIVPALNKFHTEEKNLDGLQRSCRLTGKNDPMDSRKGVIVEPGMKNPITGVNYDTHQSSRVNISVQSSTSKDDLSTPHFGLAVPCALPNETHGQTRISVTPSQRLTSPRPLVKQFHANAHNGLDTSGEAQVRNGRSRGDARGRNQLLPRYWPKITDQELQQISGDSNSVITPLFEKMLSASDAGRIGRLVLPKKCAEAYFPTISHPEGLPLKVQDAKGKEWVFQFRFWPNNNSRMYVLEGVTPCIQSMQLQAGDTVTFSRIDPDGKLVMGFRKASTVPTTEQESKAHKTANSVSTNREVNRKNKSIEGVSTPHRSLKGESTNYSLLSQVNSADPVRTWSEIDKSGYIAKEVPKAKSSLPGKRKNSSLGLKNKRLQIRKEDLIELKLTWEEAQGLLRPPPDQVPTVMVIEGYEFEEYEEAPILGRPTIFTSNHMGKEIQWVQCEDCSRWRKLPADVLLPPRWTCANNLWDPKRSSCSSAQEITSEQLEGLISSNNSGATQKTKASKQEADAVEVSDGLDTLANLAILGEGEAIPQSDQPTTKHPRHRPGCTCIVCIQPPSGKGPKHKQTCTCNVCLTVKRRFQTLMLRREKRQSEKEAETARKKQQLQFPAKLEQEDEPPMSSNANNSSPNHKSVGEGVDEDHLRTKSSSSPFKGQIDLNIQPEREDELSSPVSDSGSVIRLPPDASEKHLRQPCSADDDDAPSNQIEQGGEEKLRGDDMDVEVEHLVTSSNMPVPNS